MTLRKKVRNITCHTAVGTSVLFSRCDRQGKVVANGDGTKLMHRTVDGVSDVNLFLSSGGDAAAQSSDAFGDTGYHRGETSLVVLESFNPAMNIVNGCFHPVNHLNEVDDVIVQTNDQR